MPVTIPIQVQVPTTYIFNVEELQSQITEYAQSLIDNAVNAHRKVYSATELASHTCSPEELRDDLITRVKTHFHSEA